MTAHNPGPSAGELRIGGASLATIIERRRPALTDAVLARLVADLDVYDELPPEALRGDIADAIRRGIALFLDTLSTSVPPAEDALAELSESAARRAEERVPLDAVVGAYLIGTQVVIEQVAELADEQETRDLAAAVSRSLDFLRTMTTVVIERFQEERQLLADVRTGAEQALLNELVAGTFDASAHPDHALAPQYEVVRLAIGAHPDERAGGFGASVAAHRKLRRLRAELDRIGIDGTIARLGPDGGIVLVPVPGDGGGAPDPDVDEVVDRLTGAGEAPIHAAAVRAAAPDAIAGAAVLASEVLALAEQLGKAPGLHRLADVKVEFQLNQPTEARRLLAATLAPIAERDDLVLTLRTFLDCRLNRRRAALDLGVHPNTVDYRLRKVADLTGLDATDPTDAFELLASLRAHAAEASSNP